ncbi:MAG TPA: NAD(P)H-hydrate epimerase, partial [Burkholderiaceae bacterium]|nr:NAD(P)H-hydrate epimerase [Burkholderiaceae bacterium]
MRRLDPFETSLALHAIDASRRIESRAAAGLPPHTLMQRAGLSVARLAIAIAPHARRVWIAAGPGNNGGDGFEAALHLRAAGRDVRVAAFGDPARLPADAAAARARAVAAGVRIETAPPADPPDLAIDALLGLGATRPPDDAMRPLLDTIRRSRGARLAVDLPTGLDGGTGERAGALAVEATHTLALLTLKPGLFTGAGRELAGELWFDDLGADAARAAEAADAWCTGHDLAMAVWPARGHGGHKGRYGDVVAVGGAPGMGGALVLAARSALAGGAGRVFACALDASWPGVDLLAPELMWRPTHWREPSVLDAATV